MKINSMLFTVALALSCSNLRASTVVVDQSQREHSYTADLSSSGLSGQTFQAGDDGLLLGVRLFVLPEGFSTSPVLGSDIILSLRSVSGGAPTNTILATGYFFRADFTSNDFQEIDVIFDDPYWQSEGERLAFTILGTSGGGVNGYNEWGMNSNDLYSSGQRFYSFFEGVSLSGSDRDFSFETLISIPEPSMSLLLMVSCGMCFYRQR